MFYTNTCSPVKSSVASRVESDDASLVAAGLARGGHGLDRRGRRANGADRGAPPKTLVGDVANADCRGQRLFQGVCSRACPRSGADGASLPPASRVHGRPARSRHRPKLDADARLRRDAAERPGARAELRAARVVVRNLRRAPARVRAAAQRAPCAPCPEPKPRSHGRADSGATRGLRPRPRPRHDGRVVRAARDARPRGGASRQRPRPKRRARVRRLGRQLVRPPVLRHRGRAEEHRGSVRARARRARAPTPARRLPGTVDGDRSPQGLARPLSGRVPSGHAEPRRFVAGTIRGLEAPLHDEYARNVTVWVEEFGRAVAPEPGT